MRRKRETLKAAHLRERHQPRFLHDGPLVGRQPDVRELVSFTPSEVGRQPKNLVVARLRRLVEALHHALDLADALRGARARG